MRVQVLGGDGYIGWLRPVQAPAPGHEAGIVEHLLQTGALSERRAGAAPVTPSSHGAAVVRQSLQVSVCLR